MNHLIRAILTGCSALAVWLLPVPAQAPPAGPAKELIATLEGSVGVDRGLRGEVRPRTGRVEREPRGDRTYVSGRVLVKWRPGREPAVRDLTRDAIPARGIDRPDHAGFTVLRLAEAADVEDVARRLSDRDDVEYAQPAYRVHTRLRPNDPRYSAQWNFPAIDLERAWDINP